MSELVAALFGLVGTCVGGATSWFANQKLNQVSLAFEMHSEFSNSECSLARSKAYNMLNQYPGKDFDEVSSIEGEAADSMWFIARFYQRLWLALKYKKIKAQLVPELFGEVFYHWYLMHYEEKLVSLPYQIGENIKELKTWFDKHTPRQERSRWVDHCLKLKQNMRQAELSQS